MQEKICGAGNAMIFQIVEYFFILQHFQKIYSAGSVSEEETFRNTEYFFILQY